MLRVFSLPVVAATIAAAIPAMPAIAEPPKAESLPIPEVATVLPQNTAYVSITPQRPEPWQPLEQYAFFKILQDSDDAGSLSPQTLPFLPATLDHAAEIAPWLGDATALAVLPLPRSSVITPLSERQILVAPITESGDPTGLAEAITQLREAEPTNQVYRGIAIAYWEPQFLETAPEEETEAPALPPLLNAVPEEEPIITPEAPPVPDVPGLAIARVPNFLIAAENPAAIQAWIDQRPPDESRSLAADPGFQQTLAHPQYEAALGVTYGIPSEMVKYALSDGAIPNVPQFPLPPGNIPPGTVTQLSTLLQDTRVEVLLYPRPEGIRAQGRFYFGDGLVSGLDRLEPAPTEVLSTVSDASYLALTGQGIAQTWQGIAAGLEATEETAELLARARATFQLVTGLDLDQDFFGWMDRGFALYLFPTRQTPLTLFFPGLDIGLGIALQTSDRATAEATLTRLDTRLGSGFATLESRLINGQPASGWGFDFNGDTRPDSFLAHGWAGNDTVVITTSLGSLGEVLTLSTRQRLTGSPLFRRATQDFPVDNQGYLYSNLAAVRSLVYRLIPLPLIDTGDDQFWKALGTVQTVSGTTAFTDDYLQLDGLLGMSPARIYEAP